jgi:protein-tyrosine phosphatase/arsenate reductase
MFSEIKTYCEKLSCEFDKISAERKTVLKPLCDYIQQQIDAQKPINLLFVCTHNSRRSHFGQIWAAVAATYFEIPNVATFSGGTETTRFNENAIAALMSLGFEINSESENENPVFDVQFAEHQSVCCFSKRFDDVVNPTKNFAAIMTCSDAEQNCPLILGAEKRLGICYDDPKAFDKTPFQHQKYLERCEQIALEMLFIFSSVKMK